MAYTIINFPTKKALKEAVSLGHAIKAWQPGIGPDLSHYTGAVYIEGPHYPQPHRWYASCQMENGVITYVK